MKYYGMTEKPKQMTEEEYIPMAKTYWGVSPLPAGAVIIGGYSDNSKVGALIQLKNGRKVCGNAGSIRSINNA